MLDWHDADQIPGAGDPALRAEIAHRTAAALVHGARESEDPDVVDRLIHLVEVEGLDVVAALWADCGADTLPGALWRLYVLREWVRRDAETITHRYRLGIAAAPVAEAIAGAATTPGPQDLRRLTDAVLTGVYAGDLAVALERAAAFCRILATGAAFDADALENVAPRHAGHVTFAASSLSRTADEFEDAARLWRSNRLD